MIRTVGGRTVGTQGDYAKHRGVSEARVSQLKKSGKLPLRQDGLIDFDIADATLDALTDGGARAMQQARSLQGGRPRKDGSPARSSVPGVDDPRIGRVAEQRETDTRLAFDEMPVAERLLVSRATKADEDARTATLKRKQLEGSLISREMVERAQNTRAAAEREALMNWPLRICADMAVDLDVDRDYLARVLGRYVREFLEERSKAAVKDAVAATVDDVDVDDEAGDDES